MPWHPASGGNGREGVRLQCLGFRDFLPRLKVDL